MHERCQVPKERYCAPPVAAVEGTGGGGGGGNAILLENGVDQAELENAAGSVALET